MKKWFVEEIVGNWGEEKSVWTEFDSAISASDYYLEACEDYDVAVKLYVDDGNGKQLLEQTEGADEDCE